MRAVLVHPVVDDVVALLVVAKYALLAVVVICLVRPSLLARLTLTYYAAALVVVAVGSERRGHHPVRRGLAGRYSLIQLVVASLVGLDVRRGWSHSSSAGLHRARLWVLAPMALAWLFPYVLQGQDAKPGLPLETLANESGLTYRMLTPVVLGLLVLHSDEIHPPTLAIVSWTGMLFGVTNLLTWFGLYPSSWWMGVLHVPLTILSGYAAWLSRRRATADIHSAVRTALYQG